MLKTLDVECTICWSRLPLLGLSDCAVQFQIVTTSHIEQNTHILSADIHVPLSPYWLIPLLRSCYTWWETRHDGPGCHTLWVCRKPGCPHHRPWFAQREFPSKRKSKDFPVHTFTQGWVAYATHTRTYVFAIVAQLVMLALVNFRLSLEEASTWARPLFEGDV